MIINKALGTTRVWKPCTYYTYKDSSSIHDRTTLWKEEVNNKNVRHDACIVSIDDRHDEWLCIRKHLKSNNPRKVLLTVVCVETSRNDENMCGRWNTDYTYKLASQSPSSRIIPQTSRRQKSFYDSAKASGWAGRIEMDVLSIWRDGIKARGLSRKEIKIHRDWQRGREMGEQRGRASRLARKK